MFAGRLLLALPLALLLAFQPSAARAATPTYDAIYVFGDSYSDVGNIFIATKGAQPAFPYYHGRFSNGPIWVEHLAGSMGLPMLPSLAGGTDFAVGGAEVTNPVPEPGNTFIPDVPQQVESYLSLHSGKADPNALYIIEGGGNDILNANGAGSPDFLGFQIAFGISQSELLLRRAGAKNFLISNLVDVSLIPAAKPHAAFAQAASLAANKSLDTLLLVEQLLEGVRIHRLNSFNLLNSLFNDPTHFGFLDVTNPCLTTTVCADPDHTYFWDSFHPTVFGHSFIAVAAETALSQ